MKRRFELPEILDREGHDPRALARSLGRVTEVNRWLGGIRSLKAPLEARRDDELRILDVGTGSGAVPRILSSWAEEHGGRWSFVGLDPHPEILAHAHSRTEEERAEHRLRLVRGDGLRLPFRDGAFDASLAVLTLHHLSDASAVRLVEEMARVSRWRILVSDLERHPLHLLGARILAATLWRADPITRHDGPRSVRRSFTPGELRVIGGKAGLEAVRVRRFLPFRLLLEGRPPDHGGSASPQGTGGSSGGAGPRRAPARS